MIWAYFDFYLQNPTYKAFISLRVILENTWPRCHTMGLKPEPLWIGSKLLTNSPICACDYFPQILFLLEKMFVKMHNGITRCTCQQGNTLIVVLMEETKACLKTISKGGCAASKIQKLLEHKFKSKTGNQCPGIDTNILKIHLCKNTSV